MSVSNATMIDNCVVTSLMSNSASWSLKDDESLLSLLETFSQNFLSRTNQVVERIDKLALQASSVQTKLDNANNNFMLLSNTKFIEARVYDDSDDVEVDEPDPGHVGDSVIAEEDIIKEALGYGISLVQNEFEKVQVQGSDSESEDEEDKQFYVLEPVNKYHVRQLPAIIGTNEWFDDDKIGLGEDSDEEEVNEEISETESEDEDVEKKTERKSESEYSDSEPEDPSKNSPSQTTNASKTTNVMANKKYDSVSEFSDDSDDELFKPKPVVKVDDTEKERDDIENEVKTDEETDEDVKTIEAPKKSFADELSQKLGLSKEKPPSVQKPIDDVDDQSKSVSNNDQKQSNSPDELKKKSTSPKNLKKKSVLFDSDSDSDDDLFAGRAPLPKKALVKTETKSNVKKDHIKSSPVRSAHEEENPSVKQINKIENETGIKVDKEVIYNPSISKSADINSRPKMSTKNIFGDSSDDEDIFADLHVPKPVVDKNDEKSEELDDQVIVSAPQDIKKKSTLFDSDSDSDDIFSDLGGKLTTGPKDSKKDDEAQTIRNAVVEEIKTVKEEESDDEDIFAPTVSTSFKPEPISAKEVSEAGLVNTPDTKENVKNNESEPPKKPPPGGKSMFGAFNPAKLFQKKKSEDSSEDEVDDDSNKLIESAEIFINRPEDSSSSEEQGSDHGERFAEREGKSSDQVNDGPSQKSEPSHVKTAVKENDKTTADFKSNLKDSSTSVINDDKEVKVYENEKSFSSQRKSFANELLKENRTSNNDNKEAEMVDEVKTNFDEDEKTFSSRKSSFADDLSKKLGKKNQTSINDDKEVEKVDELQTNFDENEKIVSSRKTSFADELSQKLGVEKKTSINDDKEAEKSDEMNLDFDENEKIVSSRKTSFADELSKKLGLPKVNSSPKDDISVPDGATNKEDFVDQINVDMEVVKPALTTVNKAKARPKTSVKRRPSTKAGRKKVSDISVFDDGSKEKDVDTVDSDSVENQQTKTSITRKSSFKPPVGGVSLFGGSNPLDVLKAKKRNSITPLSPENLDQEKQINAPSNDEYKKDDKEDNKSSPSIDPKRLSLTKPPMGGVSLFGGFNPAEVLKSRKQSLEKSSINSSPADFVKNNPTPTDAFSQDKDLVEVHEPPPMENVEKKTSFDIFGDDEDDDDDLFGELLSKSSAKPTNTKSSTMFDLDGEDDDDDLFADLLKK